jgi:Serine dehydratase beta chain.
VPRAVELARQHGIDIRFVEEEGPSPIHHPNTAVLEVSNDNHSIELTACSIGGGAIEIGSLSLIILLSNRPDPSNYCLLDHGKKHPNAVELTGVVEKIAPFYRKHSLKGPINDIYEFDIKII